MGRFGHPIGRRRKIIGRTGPPRHNGRQEKRTEKVLLYCSFCGKSQHEGPKLIAGPSVFICDECIELCNDIIRDECRPGRRQPSGKEPGPRRDQA